MSIDKSAIGNFALEAIDSIEGAYEEEMKLGAELNVEEMVLVCAVSLSYPGEAGRSSSIVYHSSEGRFWSTAGLLEAARESIYRDA